MNKPRRHEGHEEKTKAFLGINNLSINPALFRAIDGFAIE
jgi:hypothetical protein